jgi:hypothetical protein
MAMHVIVKVDWISLGCYIHDVTLVWVKWHEPVLFPFYGSFEIFLENINSLEKVQRRAARYTCNRHHNTSGVSEMLNTMNWQTLQERRLRTRLIMWVSAPLKDSVVVFLVMSGDNLFQSLMVLKSNVLLPRA